MVDGDRLTFVVTAFAVVVLPGLAARILSTVGYDTLGTITWATGYGLGVVFVWYVWIRPLDIRSPAADTGSNDHSNDR